jgi:hypothetical protein
MPHGPDQNDPNPTGDKRMKEELPAEKKQMMILGLGGATVAAVGLLIWMIAGQFQREQLVQNALPSKPIPGFGAGGASGSAPAPTGGTLPAAPPMNTSLPGAPAMPR